MGVCALSPFQSVHFDLSGEPVAHLAVLLPLGMLVAWVLTFGWTTTRTGIVLRAFVRRRSLGAGPLGSTVIAEPRMLVAVPRVGQARILVSNAALAGMERRAGEQSGPRARGANDPSASWRLLN